MKARVHFDHLFRGFRSVAAATALGSVLALSVVGGAQAQQGPLLRGALSDDLRQIEAATPAQMLARARAEGSLRVMVGFEGAVGGGSARADDTVSPLGERIAASRATVVAGLQNSQVVREYETIPYVVLNVSEGDLARLMETPGVSSIVEDGVVEPLLDTSVQVINANRLWNQHGITGTGWSVAVLDTGIRYPHRAFTDATPISGCFSSNTNVSTSLCRNQASSNVGPRAAQECAQTTFGCGHGTHVAGTAAGNLRRNNRGVAFDSTIIPVQVFSEFTPAACGRATPCVLAYNSDIVAGLEFVLRQAERRPIASVNMSLGGGRYYNYCDSYNPAMTAVSQFLVASNVAVVVASGNNGYSDSVSWPACVSWNIAVGATNDNDQIASFSNQAPWLTRLMAPGVNINAPYFGGPRATAELSGTSMASPHVAGAFALLRSAFPNASVAQMLTALQCTGVPVNRPSQVSYPRINLLAARNFLNQGRTSC